MDDNTVVQYIVVRKDLGWPKGALVAQGAHASTAAIWLHRDDATVQQYMGDLDNMHKIVLAAENEESLKRTAERLESAGLQFKLWCEQPDNVHSSLATKPYPRGQVKDFFAEFKLLR
jgi:peptidyl-tRNA hydrolase